MYRIAKVSTGTGLKYRGTFNDEMLISL